MPSKSKHSARDAIESLKQYLRRDTGGMRLVDSISRYLGELRQERTALKNSNERLASQVATLSARCQQLETGLDDVRGNLAAESSQRRQAEYAAALAATAVREMEGRLVPPPPRHLDINQTRWWRMFRDLRLRMPKAPARSGGVEYRGKVGYVFEVSDFIPNLTNAEFQDLGQFVAVSLMGFLPMVGFSIDECKSKSALAQMKNGLLKDTRGSAWTKWCKDWIDWGPKWKGDVRDRTVIPLKVQTP